MGLGNGFLRGMVVIIATLVCINVILYVVLPPAQPLPTSSYAEQARQSAQAAGRLAAFYDFDGAIRQGWHEVEADRVDGATFQYMAETTATLALDVGCSAPYTLEIAVLASHIRPETPVITATLNDTPVILTQQRGVRRWIYRAQLASEDAGNWRLGLTVERLVRPSSFFAEDDDRLLGAGLDWVLVSGAACP